MLHFKTLRTTLIVRILGIIVPLTLLGGGYAVWEIHRLVVGSMEDQVEITATSYEKAAEDAINFYLEELGLMARNPAFQKGDIANSQVMQELEFYQENSKFREMVFADAQGNTTEGKNIADRNYFDPVIRRGQPWITSPMIPKEANETVLTAAAPVFGPEGEIVGMLMGRMDVEAFCSVVDEMEFGEGGYAFIVDANGLLVAHPDRAKVKRLNNYFDQARANPKENGPLGDAIREVVSSSETTVQNTSPYRFNGVDYVAAYLPIPNAPEGWKLCVATVPNEYMSHIYQRIKVAVLLLLLFQLIGVFTAVRLAKQIADPIQKEAARLDRLAEGDVHTAVEEVPKCRHEVYALSRAMQESVSSLNRYIGSLTESMSHLSEGDFSFVPPKVFRGDFLPVEESMSKLIGSLGGITKTIQKSAGEVNSSATQISRAAGDLAQATTEQSHEVDIVSGKMEELVVIHREVLENTQRTWELSRQSQENLADSAEKMERMSASMEEIERSAAEITAIITMIDSIAFQTNILSLNAAVEAARAGPQGKGFATVADEVRNLANKTSGAAEQSKRLLHKTTTAIQEGADHAREFAGVMQTAVQSFDKVADRVEAIHTGTQAGGETIEEINSALLNIVQEIHNNSATSENLVASSEQLTVQARLLNKMISNFKVDGHQPSRPDRPKKGNSNVIQLSLIQ